MPTGKITINTYYCRSTLGFLWEVRFGFVSLDFLWVFFFLLAAYDIWYDTWYSSMSLPLVPHVLHIPGIMYVIYVWGVEIWAGRWFSDEKCKSNVDVAMCIICIPGMKLMHDDIICRTSILFVMLYHTGMMHAMHDWRGNIPCRLYIILCTRCILDLDILDYVQVYLYLSIL